MSIYNPNIVEALNYIGHDLEPSGTKFKGECPFHTTYLDFLTMLVDPEKNTFSCLYCGEHGDPEYLLKSLYGGEAWSWFGDL